MIGKKWRRILIFSIIMCLNACGNTLCTKDEMLQAMKNGQDGNVIICTNEKAKKVRVEIMSKNKKIECKEIDVDKVPFVYYMNMSEYAGGYDVDYRFLDQDGVDL